jgi:hypothetical protein
VTDFLKGGVPKDKLERAPKFCHVPVSAFAMSVTIALGLYFLITTYDTELTSKYLSFDPNSGDCIGVSETIDNTFLINSDGMYDTKKKYKYPSTMYETDWISVKVVHAMLHETGALT